MTKKPEELVLFLIDRVDEGTPYEKNMTTIHEAVDHDLYLSMGKLFDPQDGSASHRVSTVMATCSYFLAVTLAQAVLDNEEASPDTICRFSNTYSEYVHQMAHQYYARKKAH